MKPPLSATSIRLFPYFARRGARTIDRYLLLTDSIVAAALVNPPHNAAKRTLAEERANTSREKFN